MRVHGNFDVINYISAGMSKLSGQIFLLVDNVFVTTVSMIEQSGFIPDRGKRFLSFPKPSDRLWCTLSLLFNGYQRILPLRLIGRGVKQNTHHRLLLTRLKMSEAVLSYMPSWRAQGRFYLLPSYFLCQTLNAYYHFAS